MRENKNILSFLDLSEKQKLSAILHFETLLKRLIEDGAFRGDVKTKQGVDLMARIDQAFGKANANDLPMSARGFLNQDREILEGIRAMAEADAMVSLYMIAKNRLQLVLVSTIAMA